MDANFQKRPGRGFLEGPIGGAVGGALAPIERLAQADGLKLLLPSWTKNRLTLMARVSFPRRTKH